MATTTKNDILRSAGIAGIIFILALPLMAQDLTNNLKLYNTLGITKDINKKASVSVSGTMIGDAITGQFEYFQFGAAYEYKAGKRSVLELGADAIRIKEPGNEFRKYYRVSASYQYQHKWQWFQLNHGAEVEYFMPIFSKFQSRWSIESEISTRKSWTGLKIRPFTRFKLYYYQGGSYASYYDEDGDLIAKKSPNDIHRWRWYGGLKLRVMKSVAAKICYFWNEEFNAGLNANSDLNIYNKSKTGIRLPFNSYGALSAAITIQL